MSNAYIFEFELNGDSKEIVAVGHTSGAVVCYELHSEYSTDFTMRLDLDDLKELVKIAEESSR